MNTLVIHPEDRSTRFLSRVYEGLNDVTLVTGGVSRLELRNLMKAHDRIMMLGHGSPHGLMSVGKFPESQGFVINDSHADILAEKDNSVFIWCNADEYVRWNRLKGFYTGMFISEVGESWMLRVNATQKDVDESNETFCDIVGKLASRGHRMMWAAAKHRYGLLAKTNAVARYNHERLYCS